MSDQNEIDKGHEPHQKELQLGVDPEAVPDRGDYIDPDENPEAIDALWEDATTVEGFAEGLAALAPLLPDEIETLRQAREG